MVKFIQVITTVGSSEDAQMIARTLVKKRLAACVQVLGPITSIYRWKGQVERAEEWQCVIKSSAALFKELETAVRAVHPYETPEIIATEIRDGGADYLAWLQHELKSP